MIRRAKSRNPQAVVAACGCYVQTHTPEAQELGMRTSSAAPATGWSF